MSFFKREERKKIYDEAFIQIIDDNLKSTYDAIQKLFKAHFKAVDALRVSDQWKIRLNKNYTNLQSYIESLYKTLHVEVLNNKMSLGQAIVIINEAHNTVKSFNNPLSPEIPAQIEKLGSLARNSELSPRVQRAVLNVKYSAQALSVTYAVLGAMLALAIGVAIATGGVALPGLIAVGVAYVLAATFVGSKVAPMHIKDSQTKQDLIKNKSVDVENAAIELHDSYKTMCHVK